MSQSSPGAAPDTVLRFESVRKTYGDRVVLADVDLTVGAGDVVTNPDPALVIQTNQHRYHSNALA